MAHASGGETPAETRRLDRATALAAAAVALLAYGAALPARITFGGDCGELATAAWCLGVPHPTGYPLWLLLAKAASLLLPWGSIAWRMAALSAICGALTVGVCTWLVVRATHDRPAGLVAGLTLLCCGPVGSQATIVEVYTLQLAVLAMVLFAQLEWVRTRDQRWLALLGLGYGLALCCHVSVVLFAPGTLLLLLLTGGDGRRRWQAVARVAGWTLPPLLLYLVLPLRAHLGPPLNTGGTDTVQGLLDHLTGRIYRGNFGAVSGAELARYVGNHLYYLVTNLRWATLLALAGAWALLSQRQPPALALLPGAGLALLFAGLYRVGDRANYVLPVYLVAAALAGCGAAWLRVRLARHWPDLTTTGQVSFTVIVLLLPLLPSWPGWQAAMDVAWRQTSMAGNDRAAQLLDAILDAAPQDAALLVLSDEVAYGLWYEQVVEGRRRDLLIGALGRVETPDGWARCAAAVQRQAAARPVATAFWDARLATLGRWDVRGPIAVRRGPGAVPEVRLGGLGRVDDSPEPRPCPAAPGWWLRRATLDVAVQEPGGEDGPTLRLKPRTLAAVRAVWQAGAPADYEAVVACFHRSEAARHEPRWAGGVGRIVNDSSGQPVTFCLLRQPFGPVADGYRLAANRLLDEDYPLALPERSLSGTWVVRVGLVPRGRPLDAAAAWAATVAAGTVETFER